MKSVVQRVSSASVAVEGRVVGRCGLGLCLLVAAHRDDTPESACKMAHKVANLRVFGDAGGKMNLSLLDLIGTGTAAGALAVSNFTVYGDTAKNRRPSFVEAAPFEAGQELFESFVASLRELGVPTETGLFGAHMEVALVNDGPVTVILEV